jgi:TolA-binding protein
MKKEERHQIKRDDLATALGSASDYYVSHRRRVITWGAVVVVVAIAGFAGRSWWQAREAQSARVLGELIRTYNAPITATIEDLQAGDPNRVTFTSTEERDRKVIEQADVILKQGGSGVTIAGAELYKGMAQADMKQGDAARQSFDEVMRRDPRGVFGQTARLRTARLLEGQGKAADALVLYQAIADDASGLLPREEGLVGMARCQSSLGKMDEARKIYQRIVSEFPNSEYAGEARTRAAGAS